MSIVKFTKNFSCVLVARIITTILATGASILLIRFLGPQYFGIYSYVVTIMGMVMLLSDFGIPIYLVQQISRHPQDRSVYFVHHLTLQIIISLTAFLIILVLIYFEPRNLVKSLILISSIGFLFNSFHIPFASVLTGMQEMKYMLVTSIVSGIATLILILLGIILKCGLPYFIFTTVIPGAVSFVVAFFFAYRWVRFDFKIFDRKRAAQIFSSGLPFFALIGCGVLYSRIDVIMLNKMTNDLDVGLYSAAYKIIFLLYVIPSSLYTILYPKLSGYHQDGTDKIELILPQLSKYMLIFGFLVTIAVYFLAPYIIAIIFGRQYVAAVAGLKILIWMYVPYCLYIVYYCYLTAGNHIKFLTLASVIGIIMNVSLNLILIPKYSFLGAAFATVCTEAAVALLVLGKTRSISRKLLTGTSMFEVVSLSFIGFALLQYSNPLIGLPIFTALFVAALLLTQIVRREELKLFSYILRNIIK